jgi:uncharacterized Ntn-hydrolase superfamily protein
MRMRMSMGMRMGMRGSIRHFRCFIITGIFVFFISSCSYATWSIIIIDPKTNEIGIAGASCTNNCYGIGGIVPGKGAIIVQAMSNKDAKAKGLQMILSDMSPEQIIEAIRNPVYDPERQQYAVVTTQNMDPVTYTGNLTHPFNGALTAYGISVQGNTLANQDQIATILEAALAAQRKGLPVDAILMIALEAGAIAGGDKRCGDQKASTAFITVARPTDKPKKPYLNLIIFGQQKSGLNAVLMLRKKYDKWVMKQEGRE